MLVNLGSSSPIGRGEHKKIFMWNHRPENFPGSRGKKAMEKQLQENDNTPVVSHTRSAIPRQRPLWIRNPWLI